MEFSKLLQQIMTRKVGYAAYIINAAISTTKIIWMNITNDYTEVIPNNRFFEISC
jgi:hypothetical protein